jgi:2-C-methyl-D-erythritol 2,4-cyclodiphosphate synthase
MRIGHGFDLHRLVDGRKLILGGIEIGHPKGLLGHSDADCLIHALADSILGALALPDIGYFFPDSDPKNKDINSKEILIKAHQECLKAGYTIANSDLTIIAEEPKMAPHVNKMKDCIAQILAMPLLSLKKIIKFTVKCFLSKKPLDLRSSRIFTI